MSRVRRDHKQNRDHEGFESARTQGGGRFAATVALRACSRGGGRGGKYFTHDKSYYPVPQTSMKFANINVMQPLLSEEISPETETAMKELVEKYRPVRQRTVRGETTKDKGGALPPAVYSRNKIVIEWT